MRHGKNEGKKIVFLSISENGHIYIVYKQLDIHSI